MAIYTLRVVLNNRFYTMLFFCLVAAPTTTGEAGNILKKIQ